MTHVNRVMRPAKNAMGQSSMIVLFAGMDMSWRSTRVSLASQIVPVEQARQRTVVLHVPKDFICSMPSILLLGVNVTDLRIPLVMITRW